MTQCEYCKHRKGCLRVKEGEKCESFESDWVPVTYRKLTDEEKEEMREIADVDIIDSVYTCPLPEDGQKVLITTRVWRAVEITTFYNDADVCYFEDWEDVDEVAAWMPLPKPYEIQEA